MHVLTRPPFVLALVVLSAFGLVACEEEDVAQALSAGPQTSQPATTVKAPTTYSPQVDTSGRSDVSAAMTTFFASVPDGGVVELQAGARYRVDDTITISGRKNVTIRGNGALFETKTTGYRERSTIRIRNSDNVVVQNLRIKGANPNAGTADGAYVRELEAQHGIDIITSSNVTVDAVTVTDTYGDFVYVGGDVKKPIPTNITIKNSTFARSGRQGIAVTRADTVMISGNTMTAARRASIDLEPNTSRSSVRNLTIRDNTVSGGRLLFVAAHGRGDVSNITVSGNRLRDMMISVDVKDHDGSVRRNWRVVNNTTTKNAGTPHKSVMRIMRVDGFVARNNVQPMQPRREMMLLNASNSCNVDVAANTLANAVGQRRITGSC